jgi:hypothetical protein
MCELDGEMNISPACKDYERFLNELYTLREMIEHQENKKASLAQVMKMIKLEPPKSATVESTPRLTAALDAAKAATERFGVSSVEARLAWEEYEEIAASGLDNAMGISLVDECSLESGQENCRAMEELDRIMPVLQALSLSKQAS